MVSMLGKKSRKEEILYQTERLNVRYWKAGKDARFLKKYGSDPDVAYPTGWEPVTSVLQASMMIQANYKTPFCFALEIRDKSEVIGSLSFMTKQCSHLDLGPYELEAGFWLGKEYWGKGLLKEAAEAVFDDLFENKDVRMIWCVCSEDNAQSIRVQEKLGFRYNKSAKVWQQALGKHLDSRISCLKREDWRNFHERSACKSDGS